MSDFPIPEAFTVRTEQYGDASVVVPTGELRDDLALLAIAAPPDEH